MSTPAPYRMPTPAPAKSLGEKMGEYIIILIVTNVIAFLLKRFVDFLFLPLASLTATHDGAANRILFRIQKKQLSRDIRRYEISRDADDPMVKYSIRFIEEPDQYKSDPDNAVYLQWFTEWKKGNIADPTLRWAPSCLEPDDTMRRNFIQYLKIQWAIHKKAHFLKKLVILDTVRRYYPELTPTFKGMECDLANYETEAIGETCRG